jgi:hypothetical protein
MIIGGLCAFSDEVSIIAFCLGGAIFFALQANRQCRCKWQTRQEKTRAAGITTHTAARAKRPNQSRAEEAAP